MEPFCELILGSVKAESKTCLRSLPPFANLEFEAPKVIGFADGIGSEKIKSLGLGVGLSASSGFVGDAFIDRRPTL